MLKPKGNRFTPPGTPYHVVELSIILLKSTFSSIGPDNYPFRYTANPNTTFLSIDTVYNKDGRILAGKPTIAVTRGPVNSNQISLGDRAQSSFPNTHNVKSGLVSSGVEYRISGRTFAEAELLGNEVYNFLLACRTVFPKLLGITHINGMSLSPTMQSKQDDNIYVCTANFSYTMQYKWYHIDPQQLIESIHFYFNDDEIFSKTINNNEEG